jgi:hypothetical protein
VRYRYDAARQRRLKAISGKEFAFSEG